jgi:hypothetical protein
MTVIKLEDKATEGGTYGIEISFFEKANPDADRTPFTPNAGLLWSLRDKYGNVINDKEDEPIDSDETITIVLSGNDLALVGGPETRYVTVEGTYNGVLGNDLVLIGEVSFQIKNLVGKP